MAAGTALFIDHGVYTSLGFLAEQAQHRGLRVVAVHSPGPDLDPRDFSLVTVLGSERSVYDESTRWLRDERSFLGAALDHGVPVFGVCFGAQLLAQCLGGEAGPAPWPELGWKTVHSDVPDLIDPGPWFQMHGDTFTLPPGATELARNACGIQAFEHDRALGVQFHPEVTRELVDEWLAADRAFVASSGEDPALVTKETAAVIADARRRAHRLFDRVRARIGG